MVLLPNDLNVDPGFAALKAPQLAKKRSVMGWDCGQSFLLQLVILTELKFLWVGRISLLHPYLIPQVLTGQRIFWFFEAWDVILSDSRGDASISFSIPNKCSTKRKLECTISEIDEDGVDVSSEESASDISSDMQGQVVPPSLCAIKGSESFNDHASLVTPDSKIAAEKKNASTSALLAKGWYPKFLWLCLKWEGVSGSRVSQGDLRLHLLSCWPSNAVW
jgi:hypothetical protein